MAPYSYFYLNYPTYKLYLFVLYILIDLVGRDSSVGIATRCGLDGPGIESAYPSGRAV